jgi:hypothetical protein
VTSPRKSDFLNSPTVLWSHFDPEIWVTSPAMSRYIRVISVIRVISAVKVYLSYVISVIRVISAVKLYSGY